MSRSSERAARDSRSPRRKSARNVPAAPSERAISLAHSASRRVRNRRLQVRLNFIESQRGEVPPLAEMLRGGRGGEVRLKLYLAMLWIAANAPHDVTFPARAWAELLDLPNPEGHGDRRVRDAISWLEDRGLIRAERKQGQPAKLFLLREDGSGSPYEIPAGAEKDKETGKIAQEHWFVPLPATFWTNGWATSLSGTAVALLLVMLVLERGRDQLDPWFWITPADARRRFALSEDTWTKATKELNEAGLLVIGRKPVSEEFGWRRVRNKYALNLERLESRIG